MYVGLFLKLVVTELTESYNYVSALHMSTIFLQKIYGLVPLCYSVSVS